MLKYLTYSLVIIAFSSEVMAQKVMERSWNASEIERISILSDAVFKIKVVATTTSEIRLKAKASGEYSENVVLDISEDEKSLVISTGYTPYFEMANDKLAAHKVISISLELVIPEELVLAVRAELASFYGEGCFMELDVRLFDGHCELSSFFGDATIITRKGAIVVHAKAGVVGTAKSQSGKVINTLQNRARHKIQAQSVNGDITLVLDR